MSFIENMDPFYIRIFFFVTVSFVIYFIIKKVLDYLYPVLSKKIDGILQKK